MNLHGCKIIIHIAAICDVSGNANRFLETDHFVPLMIFITSLITAECIRGEL